MRDITREEIERLAKLYTDSISAYLNGQQHEQIVKYSFVAGALAAKAYIYGQDIDDVFNDKK